MESNQTLINQKQTEKLVRDALTLNSSSNGVSPRIGFEFLLDKHLDYLNEGINSLDESHICLDASKPWLSYWILNSMRCLNQSIESYKERAINTIKPLLNDDGGCGGNKFHHSHLGSVYAAFSTICLVGTQEAYNLFDKEALYQYFLSLKNADGSFNMSVDGETDIRASYIVVCVASLMNILTKDLTNNVAEFIQRCQGFDGGLGCYPGIESHGGYTFCGLSTLVILNKLDVLNVKKLLEWIVNKQMSSEGGFQGRTNKLVDGCYSFWVGALHPILGILLKDYDLSKNSREKVQKYILGACQSKNGGLRDKPGKYPDYYHTCYVLSGLSITQFKYKKAEGGNHLDWAAIPYNENNLTMTAIHPIYNIPLNDYRKVYGYFNENK